MIEAIELGLDVNFIRDYFPDLLPHVVSREGGATAYTIQLPDFQLGREFKWAELRLPKGFPDHARAVIQLSPDAVLRVPHLDRKGVLCTEGDPGPGLGYSSEERILLLLHAYQEEFLRPWLNGALDGDFEKEALDYWAIEVASAHASTDPVRGVWTVDPCPPSASVRNGLLLMPNRIIVVGDEQLRITNRVVQSMGEAARQRIGVLVADIPISHALTPTTWPRTMSDLDRVLSGRLKPAQYAKFQSHRSRRGRSVHRVVLLRSSEVAFAHLLPGGPPTILDDGRRKKTFPALRRPLPLNTTRLDPQWTVGRDQYPEVQGRQAKRVLILGMGALGSPITDHLAKAGVGFISVVDADSISSANIGRHLLGAESIGQSKVAAVAQRVNRAYPGTVVIPHDMTAMAWLQKNTLAGIDAVFDFTGEPDVRIQVEQARQAHPCPLLIGWMEPYVAAAHACIMSAGQPWLREMKDPLNELEAVDWPEEVIRREPGCSSLFQSYTAAAAAHAVALIVENAVEVIDNAAEMSDPLVLSWVRGQRYLDKHWPGLKLKDWALKASPFDGLILSRPFQ